MRTFMDWVKQSGDAIKVHLPNVNQTTEYTCGAAALRAVGSYFGINWDEEKYADLLKTNPKHGTDPNSIVSAARALGLRVSARQNMTLDTLKMWLERGIPVICALQAWGDEEQYTKEGNGHFVVAIGYDKEKIYFEDPSLTKERGFLSCDDFMMRWHDKDSRGRKYVRFGAAVWKNSAPKKIGTKKNATEIE